MEKAVLWEGSLMGKAVLWGRQSYGEGSPLGEGGPLGVIAL